MRVLWFLLSGVCHQIAARSLAVSGQPLPLCARCAGMFPVIILSIFSMRLAGVGRRTGLPRGGLAVVSGLLVLAWAVDGANSAVELLWERAPLYPPANALRLITGAGMGVAVSMWLYPIRQQIAAPGGDDARAMPAWALAPAGLVAVSYGALVWWAPGWLHAALSWGLGLAVVAALALVNGLLAQAVLPWRWPRAAWGILGLALGLAEMAGMALTRLWLVGPSVALLGAHSLGII